MSQFANRWNPKPTGEGFGEKVKEAVKPSGPLKPRMEGALRQIQVQVSKLESAYMKLKERDGQIFEKVVKSMTKHDSSHATVFANELAEVRKMGRTVAQAKLALEQIVMRLNTVSELGEIVVTLAPAMSVIRGVRSGLVSVLPEAEHELSEISGMLSSILVDAGQVGGSTVSFEAANEEADKILSEASAVAEQRLKGQFPELPTTAGEHGLGAGYS